VLQSATITGLITHRLPVSCTTGFGELTQAVQPYGGYMRWDHTQFYVTWATGVLREVQNRYLLKQARRDGNLVPNMAGCEMM